MRARLRVLPARSRDEQGAVAVFIAIIACIVLVPLTAFAVDIGVQRVARRDSQAVADMVATDLSRQLDGRTYQAIMSASPSFQTRANDSAKRNSGGGNPFDVTFELGTLSNAAYDPTDPTANFVKTTSASVVPTAVKVTASGKVGFLFMPGGSGGVARSAIATTKPNACIRLGSYALGLGTNKSALNGLIGNALNLSALGYDGLANANVSLLGLATKLGAGTPDQLVKLKNLTLGQIVDASAQVLANTSPHDNADVTLLQTIKASMSNTTSGKLIDLGKLIDVGTGGGSGLDAGVNLLDLISGAAFIANGTSAITVPNLGLSLPGVGSIVTKLSVIEPAKQACYDGGVARTGQVRLSIDGTLSAGVPLVLTVGGPIHIELGLAVATGRVTSVSCVNRAAKAITVAVNEQSAATTSLSLGDPNSTPQKWLQVKALAILLGGLTVDLVNVSVSTVQQPTTGTYVLDPWQNYVTTPYKTPQTPTALPDLTANAGLLGLPLGGLLSPLLGILNPLVDAVNTLISGVLAPALGLQVAGADIFVQDLPQPSCSTPVLIG